MRVSGSSEARGQRMGVMLVDPTGVDSGAVGQFLSAWNFETMVARTPAQAIQMAGQQAASIALVCDPGTGKAGVETVRALRQVNPEMEALLLSGDGSAKLATEAFRAGAYSCLKRPIDFRQLGSDLNALRETIQDRMARGVWELDPSGAGLQGMVGKSAPMQAVFAMIRRLASEETPVLITGLVGSGKELAARALHGLSRRAGAPLVIYRCCGVSEQLAARELFGEPMDAGSGEADSGPLPMEQGVLAAARGATLLLDEVGDLPLPIQARLAEALRGAVNDGPVQNPVSPGSIRLLATSRVNLSDRTDQQGFSSDLYGLLCRNIIHLPSLSERPEDIPLLCRHFLNQFSLEYGKTAGAFSPGTERVLMSYAWPGNVRELENIIGRACLLADQDCIDWRDLSIAVPPRLSAHGHSGIECWSGGNAAGDSRKQKQSASKLGAFTRPGQAQ